MAGSWQGLSGEALLKVPLSWKMPQESMLHSLSEATNAIKRFLQLFIKEF